MTKEEKIFQAMREGNIQYCNHCKKERPVELTFFDPDNDTEETLIKCLVCDEGLEII